MRLTWILARFAVAILPIALTQPSVAQDGSPLGFVNKLGQDLDVRSGGRILADDLSSGNVILPDLASPVQGLPAAPQIQFRGGNVQVNNPALDYVQIFPGLRPFVHATQSEVSTAAFGRNIVVTYNNSAGIHVTPNPSGPGVIVDRVQISGFSTSQDGGQTWTSGFMPPAAGASETFGDPSIGVDRHGVFYFANLGADSHGLPAIQVNKSADGGSTWTNAVVVQQDSGSDKEWLAVGRDPVNKDRDNVYVTWTSFQTSACQLRFGRSFDGGMTWDARTIFVPTADPNPTHPQTCLTFTNPVVDSITGSLYIPFLRFSNSNQDFIQMLISDDAGTTFRFATFNVPGAPDATVMPVTQSGELTECGATLIAPHRFSVNVRLTVHTANNTGPGITHLPRYTNASRMTLQPALAARNGTLFLAWSNSTSLVFGDPNGGSNVWFIRSDDAGNTWTSPVQVQPAGSRRQAPRAARSGDRQGSQRRAHYVLHPARQRNSRSGHGELARRGQ